LANPLLNTWKGLDLLLWLCRFAASFNLNNSAWRWSIFCNMIQTVKLKPWTLEHTCSIPNHLLFLFCNKFCEVLHLPSTSINCNMQKYETNESWERERERDYHLMHFFCCLFHIVQPTHCSSNSSSHVLIKNGSSLNCAFIWLLKAKSLYIFHCFLFCR
jgi:hypothetical protein